MRLRRKVCLLGAPDVGKTSIVRRFVEDSFDEGFTSSIDVGISKGVLQLGDVELQIMLWDPGGSEPWAQYNRSFISGASGLVFVADTTRPQTLDHLLEIQVKERGFLGNRPSVLILNKVDLTDRYALTKWQIDAANLIDWHIVKASAQVGENVREAFGELATMMLEARKVSA